MGNLSPEQAISGLRQLWKLAFGDTDAFLDGFFGTAFSFDRCRWIEADHRIVAALYWFDCRFQGEKLAYLYAVATHPDYRGRGLCRKLMANVHDLLAQQGYNSVMLVPADEGLREMYRKMGYETCSSISEISCTAADLAVEIRNVSPEEYAALRRKLLPESGVIQERKNLTFLAAQTQLFAGEDFLLAAWLEEDTLHGPELLGNTAAAPGILRALGCKNGKFQIPGNEKAFAMIHKLHEAAVMPKYFGFSFD